MRFLVATSAVAAAAAFTCAPPKTALSAPFLGSWSSGIGQSRYHAEPHALSVTLGADTAPDVQYCILDAFVPPTNAARAFITIGNAHNTGSNVDVACALLDVSGLPQSVEWGLEFAVANCPTSSGLNFTGWQAPTKLACPPSTAAIPAALRGNGSMVPAGYKANSFVETSAAAFTFVNEGALVSTWCAGDVAPAAGAPAGVTQVTFANSAAPGADSAAGEFAGVPWTPGAGCVWLARASDKALSFKWGTLECPTNFTGALTIPFAFYV